MDWSKARAETLVCAKKNVQLKDIVQLVLDGFTKPREVMEELALTDQDDGVDQIPEILDIFVPVINADLPEDCNCDCTGGCSGCRGGCCGE